MCASFRATAWICACQATDRDLESSSTMKRANAWICALLTTDHDLASATPDGRRHTCNHCNFLRTFFFFFFFFRVNESRYFLSGQIIYRNCF